MTNTYNKENIFPLISKKNGSDKKNIKKREKKNIYPERRGEGIILNYNSTYVCTYYEQICDTLYHAIK